MHTLFRLTVCDLSRSKKWVLKSVLKDLNSAMLYDAEIILFYFIFLTSLISDNQCSSFFCKVIASGRERLLPRKEAGRRGHQRSVGASSGGKCMPKSTIIVVQEKLVGAGSGNSFDEYVKYTF